MNPPFRVLVHHPEGEGPQEVGVFDSYGEAVAKADSVLAASPGERDVYLSVVDSRGVTVYDCGDA